MVGDEPGTIAVQYSVSNTGGESMSETSQSLDDNNKDDIKAYLDWLLDAINKYANQIRRTTLIALFLMAVFTIVSQSSADIDLKGLKVSEGSLVDTFIPALVAGLFLQLVTDTNRLIVLYGKFSCSFKTWTNSPPLKASWPLVMPPFSLAWGESMTPEKEPSSFPEKAHSFLTSYIDKVTPFIGIVFLAFAYYTLFAPAWSTKGLTGPTLATIAISSAISLIFIAFGIIAYFQRVSPTAKARYRL